MLNILMPILLMLHPASQIDPPNPDWNCDDPVQQQEMNWCADLEFASADDALNHQWAETSALMKARDEAWEATVVPQWDDRPGYFATLLEAQRAWLVYRDTHCRSDGYAARGGSLEPLLVSTCKTALTNVRTEQLRELTQTY